MFSNRNKKPRLVAALLAGVAGIGPLKADTKMEAQLRGIQPREVVLDNGLTLLLLERHEQPTVACGVFYDVGGVHDPLGRSGIAHLFEHMLFKGSKIIGTTDYEAERKLMEEQDRVRGKLEAEMNRMRVMKRRGQISDVLDPKQWTAEYAALKKQDDELTNALKNYVKNNEFANLYTTNGGTFNATTGSDATIYFVQLPGNKVELFFWLESDRMANGVMREFYTERDNVREERRLRVDSTPTGLQDEAFNALFWQSHPYGIPVIGWPSEVESINKDDALAFYRTYYAPNNARVVLVGDFQTEPVIELARQYFGRISRAATTPPSVNTEETKPVAERRFHAEAETNPRVRIRFHTVAIGHSDEPVLDVLGELLAGKTGRLYKRLVTKEEAAIGEPRAGNNGQKYAGFFGIEVTVKEGKSPEDVERMVLEEIDKLREGEISDQELQKVKNQVLAATVRRMQTNMGLMFQIGLTDTQIDWTYLNESPKRMLAVTPDEIRRVLKKYFDPKTRTVAVYRTKEKRPDSAPVKLPTIATASNDTAGKSTVNLDPPIEKDPEVAALLAKLEPKWQRTLIKRLEEIPTMDFRTVSARAAIMRAALDERELPPEQSEMFEYIYRRLLEHRLALEHKGQVQPAEK